MKCPNCNKEISPEWIICPFCKYEPIKCPNCDSSWLPQNATLENSFMWISIDYFYYC